MNNPKTALRKLIASDIYQTAQRAPMTLTTDGGELATILAELALKRMEAAGYVLRPASATKEAK